MISRASLLLVAIRHPDRRRYADFICSANAANLQAAGSRLDVHRLDAAGVQIQSALLLVVIYSPARLAVNIAITIMRRLFLSLLEITSRIVRNA